MKRKLILAWGAAAAVIALVALVGGNDSLDAQEGKGTFNPTLSLTSSDTTPETSPDVTVEFNIGDGDLQFGGVLAFIPKEAGIVPGEEIPYGAVVGTVESVAVLGIINAPCNTILPVKFEMVNGSLDKEDVVEFSDADINGQRDVFEDKDDNGNYDVIDKFPAFVNRIFPDITPIRRTLGITSVAGTGVLLQFLTYPPGTVIQPVYQEGVIITEPLYPQSGDVELGYPSLVTLQDFGDPSIKPEPGPITDFCTPLESTSVTFGTARDNTETAADDAFVGKPLGLSPLDGTYKLTIVALSQRDTDGDGLENTLDTCPLVANEGDPRVINSGDFESDGLDAACDPDDTEINSDEDLDGYLNRGDNCPLVANGQEADNQKDIDLDSIGDPCDPDPNTPNGDRLSKVLTYDIKVGAGTGPGGPPDCAKAGITCWTPGGDGGGLGTAAIAGIVAAVAAGVVVLGGAASVAMRRRSNS